MSLPPYHHGHTLKNPRTLLHYGASPTLTPKRLTQRPSLADSTCCGQRPGKHISKQRIDMFQDITFFTSIIVCASCLSWILGLLFVLFLPHFSHSSTLSDLDRKSVV